MSCANCGSVPAPGARFCGVCGQPTGRADLPTSATPPPQQALPRITNPQRTFVPDRDPSTGNGFYIAAGVLGLAAAAMQIGGIFADFDAFGTTLADDEVARIQEGVVGAGMALSGMIALASGRRGRFGAGMLVGTGLLVVGLRLDWVLRIDAQGSYGTLGPGYWLQLSAAGAAIVAALFGLVHLVTRGRSPGTPASAITILAGLAAGALVAAGMALDRFSQFGVTSGSPFDETFYDAEAAALVFMAGAIVAGLLSGVLRPGAAGGGIALGAAFAPAALAASSFYIVTLEDGPDPGPGLILLAIGAAAFLVLALVLVTSDKPSTRTTQWAASPQRLTAQQPTSPRASAHGQHAPGPSTGSALPPVRPPDDGGDRLTVEL